MMEDDAGLEQRSDNLQISGSDNAHVHYEHNDERRQQCWRDKNQGRESCTDLPTMFELLYVQ